MGDVGASQSGSRLDIPALSRSLALLAVAGTVTEAASRFIVARFPDRPIAPDALFEVLPHVPEVRYLTTAVMIAAFLAFAVFALRRMPEYIPEFISMIAIMYIFRAALIAITPLANANNGAPAAFPLFQYGMFPSGHTAVMLLLARFADPESAPGLRRWLSAVVVLVGVTMILSRSHYSIDIAGGALLAYFVEREWRTGSIFGPIRRLVRG